LVYSDEFYQIIGSNPTLTLIAKTESDPLFHEAVVWYPPTDEVFFVQNAGAEAAGTGLAKSAIIQKIALSQADAVTSQVDATGQVDVVVVDSQPQVINPNGVSIPKTELTKGATNYMGKIAFMGEGQGNDIPPAIYVMEPTPPYNTTGMNNPLDLADSSHPKQLLWASVQFPQRCRDTSPKQGNVLYRRHLRVVTGLPSGSNPP
jgi:gluconolactonase